MRWNVPEPDISRKVGKDIQVYCGALSGVIEDRGHLEEVGQSPVAVASVRAGQAPVDGTLPVESSFSPLRCEQSGRFLVTSFFPTLR